MEKTQAFAGASKLVAALRVRCTLAGLSPRSGALPWRKLQHQEAKPFQVEFSPLLERLRGKMTRRHILIPKSGREGDRALSKQRRLGRPDSTCEASCRPCSGLITMGAG